MSVFVDVRACVCGGGGVQQVWAAPACRLLRNEVHITSKRK